MNDAKAPASLLVLGGARSGKSGFAQRQVEAALAGVRVPVFIATAQAYDAEMTARIAAHVAARDARWITRDAPLDLAEAIAEEARPERILLVDCLTLWLTNVMLRGDDVEARSASLAALVPRLRGSVVFVSNEVGGGIVPDNALARRFRDAQGRLNQAMAAACGTVVLVTAGLPTLLKPGVRLEIGF
jgi:adenosylcobinamide kinase/adenosylcobinamide-phosphate guanylyltransferase